MELGRLEKIELREAWKHEALNFTGWLAKEENLSLLSDEIGISISFLQTEASVGKFSVDILAEEERSERKIVIENQLESTDHDHLGKIITYASGFDAEIIIWIVKDVRDEHKQAIDWLNENTNEKINFFAINIELWKIGDSLLAPKFNIISKPNNWAKALKKATTTENRSNVSSLQMLQLEYWNSFNEFINSKGATVNTRTARPQHWYDLSIGLGQRAYLSMIIHKREQYCSVEVYIPNSKELYFELLEQKSKIESETELNFEWLELPARQASRIQVKNPNFNLEDTSKWNDNFEWMLKKVEVIKSTFVPLIQNI